MYQKAIRAAVLCLVVNVILGIVKLGAAFSADRSLGSPESQE